MSANVKGILQRINFIETDMDLHKQILLSIPSDNREEMETVIKKIADQKKQIEALRQEIKKADETEYNRIMAIENAAETFRKISRDKKYVEVNTLNESGECYITLNDNKGTRVDCLVAAKEENGDWTVMTPEGETRQYPAGIVK